jgi:hypothetical protein
VLCVLGLLGAPRASAGTPSLSWSTPAAFDAGRTPSAVVCPSESLCLTVDREGDALTTLDPAVSTPAWTSRSIDSGQSLNAVSCAGSGPCVAVDGRGDAFVSTEPIAGGWFATSIDGGKSLTGVACPSASLCVAIDESGNLLASTSATSGTWSSASIDPGHHLKGVSCASQSLCAALDESGNVLASTDPAGGASAWHLHRVDFGELTAISCWPTGMCVAVDANGNALASSDPAASSPTWNLTPIDGERLTAISCASSGLCAAVDGRGAALVSENPAAAIPTWSAASVDSSPLDGVWCVASGFCMALDTAGRSLSGRVPAPTSTTLSALEVSSTNATLAGAVDPNGAALGACWFEYGTSVAYAGLSGCSSLPSANGGAQAVSAQLSGLAPNTTYHYRVFASSQSGASAGADATFTTATSSQVALVYPHPSITGNPAPGQRLTCHPGTPAETQAQLSYAWLRDLIPLPSATGSTYTVKNQDSSHHLQCQVTATDGGGSATAKSAFVTIPMGGIPASAGETIVGRASFRGKQISVPIVCSAHASGGCAISLRLSAVETLNGKRIVAVSAQWKLAAHKSAAALHHRTVTLASVHLHLGAGEHRLLATSLNTTGRRLLATSRRFSASVNVSGTVIGAIQAQLSHQLVALGPAARRASRRVTASR